MKHVRNLAVRMLLAASFAGLTGAARSETQVPEAPVPRDAARAAAPAPKAPLPSAAALQTMARKAAEDHALPPAYFVRLIAHESRFDAGAVSRAGAQGISQFMPGTAAARGLSNPFDPFEALPKSAEYLSDLRQEFGNLGLAAAAYNAGPSRIHRWLAGQSRLPGETLRYVLGITGRDAESWAPAGAKLLRGPADIGRPGLGERDLSAASPRNWELALLFSLAPANARVIAAMRPAASQAPRRGRRTEKHPGTAVSLEQKLCPTCIVQAVY